MYLGHSNAEVLSVYAAKKGSKCVLVVHYGEILIIVISNKNLQF